MGGSGEMKVFKITHWKPEKKLAEWQSHTHTHNLVPWLPTFSHCLGRPGYLLKLGKEGHPLAKILHTHTCVTEPPFISNVVCGEGKEGVGRVDMEVPILEVGSPLLPEGGKVT